MKQEQRKVLEYTLHSEGECYYIHFTFTHTHRIATGHVFLTRSPSQKRPKTSELAPYGQRLGPW